MTDYQLSCLMPAPGGHSFLLRTERTALLVDSGYAFSAPELIRQIHAEMGEQPLDYILLTHSHYDHCSGSVYLRREWPDVKVFGGEYAAYVFTRPSALAVIREMNENGSRLYGDGHYPDLLDQLRIDTTLRDGEDLFLGDIHIKAIATPGHTKDSVSYFWPEEKLLFASETCGTMPNPPMINPEYLVGYQMTLDSIARMEALKAEIIQVAHRRYITAGRDGVDEFFARCRYWAVETKDCIVAAYHAGASKQEMMDLLKGMYYVGEKAKGQPEDAFVLNASYTVPMLIRECCGVEI